MEVLNTGELIDPEIIQATRIVEMIYGLIYRECKSVKSKFPQDEYYILAVGIYALLKFGDVLESDISDLIYEMETQQLGIKGNRKRCRRLAGSISCLRIYMLDDISIEKFCRRLKRDLDSGS